MAHALPRVLDAGDAAFTIEYGQTIEPGLVAAVGALDAAIQHEAAAGRLPGLIETMPTFRSLTVFFDPLRTGRAALLQALGPLLLAPAAAVPVEGRRWLMPVCYEGECAPDLAETAATLGLRVEDLVAHHIQTHWRVYMLGFLPGFPFMGDLPPVCRLPRRRSPRVRVPAGSVAIAGALTAIYPWESPGGWHLLGRCPVPLFDPAQDRPALLAAGDRVRFEPVNPAEYQRLAAAVKGGELTSAHWLESTTAQSGKRDT
jgi:KipI family sensor histidine kinase inhibitor